MKRYLLLALTPAITVVLSACAIIGATGQSGQSPQAGQNAAQAVIMNWYGGPAYLGNPALKTTAALVRAGGGAQNFSFSQSLIAMLGRKAADAEIAKLRKHYGKKAVADFFFGMNHTLKDGLKRLADEGITLPAAPEDLKSANLAKTLIRAGAAPDGTFWAGHLFDVAISHKLHNRVMADINENLGPKVDLRTHQILNQAMYDIARSLGMTHVKLAALH